MYIKCEMLDLQVKTKPTRIQGSFIGVNCTKSSNLKVKVNRKLFKPSFPNRVLFPFLIDVINFVGLQIMPILLKGKGKGNASNSNSKFLVRVNVSIYF